jgi:thiosulfate dehydrogenase [quinone] large subunit
VPHRTLTSEITMTTQTYRSPAVSSHVAGSAVPATPALRYVSGAIRLSLGWIFLWAFLDKLFGLGHETTSAQAWIHGGSPTFGFLKKGAEGPFADFYHGIAGATWANWLFMIGLAGIGTALLLGIFMRIAAASGALMLVLMWSVVLPPANNLFMDDHIIYALVLVLLALMGAGRFVGFGGAWERLSIVQRYPFLK